MKFYGMYPAIVIQNNDPERAGRVKVFVPGITNTIYEGWNAVIEDKSFSFLDPDIGNILEPLRNTLPWAINASPFFGGGTELLANGANSSPTDRPTGSFSIPSVGCHVFVFFIAGDINCPALFASNYGKTAWTSVMGDAYPSEYENSGAGAYVKKYVINTNKHSLEFIDTVGSEELKLTVDGKRTIIISDDDTITIGGNYTVNVVGNANIAATGNIDMTSGGDILISAAGSVTVKAPTAINLN
jgi:hypothetical protein